MKTRILLADDHPLVRRGLRQVIERQSDLTVVAEASDGAEAVELAVREQVDLAILDVAMPRLTGLQATQQLAQRRPETRILILSMYDNDQYTLAALRAGASGYLLKSMADEEVVEACYAILRGERFLRSSTTGTLSAADLDRLQSRTGERADLLTPRELEVLKLVAEGQSSQDIADRLVISLKTVERHRSNIMNKLAIRDRVGLTRYAIRRGLVEP